jgi:hypothetical protein
MLTVLLTVLSRLAVRRSTAMMKKNLHCHLFYDPSHRLLCFFSQRTMVSHRLPSVVFASISIFNSDFLSLIVAQQSLVPNVPNDQEYELSILVWDDGRKRSCDRRPRF